MRLFENERVASGGLKRETIYWRIRPLGDSTLR
jgi:hypothetical protein